MGGTLFSSDPGPRGGSNLKALWRSHLQVTEDRYHTEFVSWRVDHFYFFHFFSLMGGGVRRFVENSTIFFFEPFPNGISLNRKYPQNVLWIFIVTPSLNFVTISPPCTELSTIIHNHLSTFLWLDTWYYILTLTCGPGPWLGAAKLAVETQAALMREEPATVTMKEW